MTTPSPNPPPAHPDDEDRVVFKSSPPAASPATNGPTMFQKFSPTPVGAKRSSLGVLAPHQPPFSPSPLLLGADVPAADQSWDLSEKLMQMQLGRDDADAEAAARKAAGQQGQEAVFPNVNDGGGLNAPDSLLGPPAEIHETNGHQPHSRQSSNGTASSGIDSPTIPTPEKVKPSQNGAGLGGKAGGSAFGMSLPPTGYDEYAYAAYAAGQGLLGMNNGAANGASPHLLQQVQQQQQQQQQQQNGQQHPAGAHFSPISGNFPRLIQTALNGQVPPSQYSPQAFGFQSPPQPPNASDLNNPYVVNGQNGANGYPAVNGQRGGVSTHTQMGSPAFGYGSPPNPYPAGMMSPTLGSPTFLPSGLNPYASPIMPAANPYGAYGAAVASSAAMNGAGYEMPQGPPGSPLLSAVQAQYGAPRQPAFAGGSQFRGRGGQAVPGSPAAMRGAAAAAAAATLRGANGAGRAPRGRGGVTLQMNGSMPMSPAAYSIPSPYGPMSPPNPYEAAYGQIQGQQQQQQQQVLQPQATSPELATLMAQMAAAGYGPGMMSPYGGGQGGGGSSNGAMSPLPNIGSRPDWMDVATWEIVQTQMGPSANNRKLGLYKTELCRSFEEKGECRYGDKCQFAHGEAEQRRVERHPKYKTEICRTFWVSGSCPYGKRCCFIHTELPSNAAANGANGQGDGQANSSTQNDRNHSGDTRNRSMSTNSDPNDNPSSLLARIAAKGQAHNAAAAAAARSTDASPANNGNTNGAGAATPTEANINAAIARAITKFGVPDASVRKVEPSPPVEVVPMPKVPAVFSNFPVGNATTTTSGLGVGGGGSGGGHHRMSASVDFGRVSRNLGSDLANGFGGGGGHARNPSASSVVPNSLLSRTPNPPLSGHSTPFGNTSTPNSGITSNGIHGSTLLDRTWA